jgi:hypothetical protein
MGGAPGSPQMECVRVFMCVFYVFVCVHVPRSFVSHAPTLQLGYIPPHQRRAHLSGRPRGLLNTRRR